MRKDDRIRLQHMRDAAAKALRLTSAGGRERLEDPDDPLLEALIHLVSVIGEAARKLDSETRDRLDEIRWSEIIGMRTRLVHRYHDINHDILWATVERDLPPLLDSLRAALAEE